MRVLQICHSYYPPFLDCARQYSVLFKGTEYKVLTVFLTGEADDQVATETASDEVVFLGYKSVQVSGLKLNAISKISAIVAKEQFTFCIAHRAKPTYVALLATNLAVISIHHNYNDFGRFSRRLLVNIFKSRLQLLGVSNSVRDDIRKQLKNWPHERIQTLYNHIDVCATQAQFKSKEAARNFLNLPADAWIVGNVGRLHHDKDQATLLRGFEKALPQLPPNSLLVIMGGGPLELKLKQLALELNIQSSVVFTGNVPNAKAYFKAFDVFALTSDCEPFGMVLLEAMAAQLPIICSDNGGGAEVILDAGQLFEFGSVDALASSIIALSKNYVNYNSAKSCQKLHDYFSDEAVKKSFWSLPFVSVLTNHTN